MNPAQELRVAAERIRARAAKATPGTWRHENNWAFRHGNPPGIHEAVVTDAALDGWETVAVTGYMDDHTDSGPTAEHIATWDPPKAFIIAAMFDAWEKMVRRDPDMINRVGGQETLELARAINGTPADVPRPDMPSMR